MNSAPRRPHGAIGAGPQPDLIGHVSVAAPALPQAVAVVGEILRDLRAPWAICGGWAIELCVGRPLRDHADVDIAVLRRDQDAVRDYLERRGWLLRALSGGVESPWPSGRRLEPPVHEVACRHPTREPGRLELLFNESTPTHFVFRRDASLTLPLGRALRPHPSGIMVLCPAVVLLYKSKHASARDEADFDAALPHLGDAERAWLLRGLMTLAPGHHWIARLSPDRHGAEAGRPRA